MYKAIVSAKGQIVIPAELRRKYGSKPGTRICFLERGHEIILQPVTKEYCRSLVGLGFFLLSGGKDYRIAHNYGIIDWDRLTDSLSIIPMENFELEG